MTAKAPAATDVLTSFKLNDMYPFSVSANDLAFDSLEQAHALTIALSVLLDHADPQTEELTIRAPHLAQALEGICTLMALSAFARDAAPKEA